MRKLYNKPAVYSPTAYFTKNKSGDKRVARIFFEDNAGELALDIVGVDAEKIARFIIERQEEIK